MRKTNRNLLLKKFYKRLFVLLLLWILFTALLIYINSSITSVKWDDLHTKTIVVEEINTPYSFLSGRTYTVISNEKEYSFAKIPLIKTNEANVPSLIERIQVGDTLTIQYAEEKNFFGEKFNIIVGAEANGEQLRTVEYFNNIQSQQRTLGIVVFCITEALFLSFITLFVLYHAVALKIFTYKKRKK